jgi:hypothetical protein
MRRTKIAALLLLAVMLGWASGGFATPPRKPYTVPSGGLIFDEFQVVSWDSAKGGILSCTLSSATGTLSQLDIQFGSSADLAVEPASAQVPALRQGEKKSFRLKVTKISTEKKDVMGTWVRLTVEYLPDFAALRRLVQAEPRRFTIQEGYLKNVLAILQEHEAQGKKEIFSQRGFLDAMLLKQ